MGLFFYTKIGSIISIGDLPTTNIIEPERRKESQLFSVNFMKKLNDFGIGLFFCLEIKFRVNLGIFLDFTSNAREYYSFLRYS